MRQQHRLSELRAKPEPALLGPRTMRGFRPELLAAFKAGPQGATGRTAGYETSQDCDRHSAERDERDGARGHGLTEPRRTRAGAPLAGVQDGPQGRSRSAATAHTNCRDRTQRRAMHWTNCLSLWRRP